MKVQVLKPLRGWRAFFGEVGIIVLGVLVALGIGQIADNIRWDGRASDSVHSIRNEWGQNGGVFEERMIVQSCLDRRLVDLDAIIREARRTGRLPEIGEIGRPPIRPLATDAWDQVTTSETLLHIDATQGRLFTAGYSQAERYLTSVLLESDMWSTMRVVEHSPGKISEPLLAELATTLAQLKDRSRNNGIIAKQEFDAIRGVGVPISYFLILDREGSRSEAFEPLSDRSICKPLQVKS